MQDFLNEISRFKAIIDSHWPQIFEKVKPMILQEVNKEEHGRKYECYSVSFEIVPHIKLTLDIVTHKLTEKLSYKIDTFPEFRIYKTDKPGIPELMEHGGIMYSGKIDEWIWDNIKEHIPLNDFPNFVPPKFTSDLSNNFK